MRQATQHVPRQPRPRKTISRLISADPQQPQRPEWIFREILEDLEVGVAACTPSGKMLWVNGRFTEILGIPKRLDPTGAQLHTFVTPRSWPSLDAALNMATRRPAEGELKIEAKQSHARKLRLRLTAIHVDDEIVIQLVAVEAKLSQANEDLQKTEASLHSLSGRLLRLQDEERRRIARDLHDITGQELAVVVMSLSHLARTIGDAGVDAKKEIAESVEVVRKVELEVRTLSYLLHPPLLDELGLVSALSWYIEGFNKRTGLHVSLVAPPHFGRLVSEKETALFRVVQEGLTNVLRHSGSQRARITLSTSDSDVQLTVEDEGKGVNAETLRKLNGAREILGVGIPGIRERLRQFGGTLRAHSNSRGMCLTAVVPRETGQSLEKETVATAAPASELSAEAAPNTSVSKRILVVDDHEMIRHGIRSLLAKYNDLEICGEAADGIEAVAKAAELKPDLIIMDLSLPRLGGLAAAHQIKGAQSSARVLVFTTHDFQGLESLAAASGCEGVVLKRKANQDLIRGVRAVLAGQRFFSDGSHKVATA